MNADRAASPAALRPCSLGLVAAVDAAPNYRRSSAFIGGFNFLFSADKSGSPCGKWITIGLGETRVSPRLRYQRFISVKRSFISLETTQPNILVFVGVFCAAAIAMAVYLEPRPVKLERPTDPAVFTLAGNTYSVPLAYMGLLIPKPNKNAPFSLRFCYPGFAPPARKAQICPNSEAPLSHIRGFRVDLFVNEKLPTNVGPTEMFENSRSSFRSQTPQSGPFGFEKYHTGPDNGGGNTYRKTTLIGTVFLSCVEYPVPSIGTQQGGCTGTFLLGAKTLVSFEIYESEIEYAEDIQSQLGHILRSFVIGDKPYI